jgi:hypothetical protein
MTQMDDSTPPPAIQGNDRRPSYGSVQQCNRAPPSRQSRLASHLRAKITIQRHKSSASNRGPSYPSSRPPAFTYDVRRASRLEIRIHRQQQERYLRLSKLRDTIPRGEWEVRFSGVAETVGD